MATAPSSFTQKVPAGLSGSVRVEPGCGELLGCPVSSSWGNALETWSPFYLQYEEG
jgi:hypothetical protein